LLFGFQLKTWLDASVYHRVGDFFVDGS
jgi:hypothetical protein